MFKESFPIIDPLAAGHKAADKILEKKKQQEFENHVDSEVSLEEKNKTAVDYDREEIYEKDPEEEWFKK